MPCAIVVGAGVGGLAAAVALQRTGWDVTVLERAPALAPVGAGIGIAPNALRALDAIGLGDAVRGLGTLHGEAGVLDSRGRWLSRTRADLVESRFGDSVVLLRRSVLVDILAGALVPGTLRLATTVHDVEPATGRVATGTGELAADLVVAADGINSGIRQALFPTHPGPVYAGVTSWRLLVPGTAGLDRSTESWGRGEIVGVATLSDGDVYCYATAVVPAGGRADDERAELLRRFGGWHEPIPALLAAPGTVLRTDIFCLDRPLPRYHEGRVALLGDAAHAMAPNLGQGGCQAVEDAVVLAASTGDLAGYTRARLARTTDVARRSRRMCRLSQVSGPAGTRLRDTAVRLAGRLGPGTLLRQFAPVFDWQPPELP